jgi:hypothetical protein
MYDPLRSLLTCGAISSALALILLLEGFQSGLLIQLKNVALNRGADLIVAQSGVSNFVASRSLLPQLSRERIEAVRRRGAPHHYGAGNIRQAGISQEPDFFRCLRYPRRPVEAKGRQCSGDRTRNRHR